MSGGDQETKKVVLVRPVFLLLSLACLVAFALLTSGLLPGALPSESTSLRGARRLTNSVYQAEEEGGGGAGGGVGTRIITQAIFGILWWFIAVSKYPPASSIQPNEASREIQKDSEITGSLKAGFPICFHSYFCSASRAAQTFHATDIINYWLGLILMIFCPFCTLWYVNSFTELNEKLGGEKKNCFLGFICTFFCSCCVIAQDAASLDAAAGVETTCCGVRGGPNNME